MLQITWGSAILGEANALAAPTAPGAGASPSTNLPGAGQPARGRLTAAASPPECGLLNQQGRRLDGAAGGQPDGAGGALLPEPRATLATSRGFASRKPRSIGC